MGDAPDGAPLGAGLVTPGPTRGSIVVDELVVPIVDIRLAHGLLVLIASVAGPVRAVSARDYRVHDQDGRLVLDVHAAGGLVWPAVPAGEALYEDCPIQLGGVQRRGSGVAG